VKKQIAQIILMSKYYPGSLLVILLLLGIITGLLYLQYRLEREREWLLKEIHHRVKNNLQIILSLLSSQLAYLEDDAAIAAIRDCRHRVHAISLIYQQLYQPNKPAAVNMHSYIRELAEYMADGFNTAGYIRFELDIAAVELEVSQAISLGLILNEAISNAIKHAFPGRTDGVINVSLQRTGGQAYVLTVADNGKGLPEDIDTRKAGTLGIGLMEGLCDDLDGSFSITGSNGTRVQVSFHQ
jgi:two-component sensor histidine kinase